MSGGTEVVYGPGACGQLVECARDRASVGFAVEAWRRFLVLLVGSLRPSSAADFFRGVRSFEVFLVTLGAGLVGVSFIASVGDHDLGPGAGDLHRCFLDDQQKVTQAVVVV